MIPYPEIDPVIVHIGPLQLRWYGMMYVLGFVATYLLVRLQIRRFNLTWLAPHFENLNFVLIVSVVLGGRLGYVLFYNPAYYLRHPLEILATWQGGMSFHGAFLAMILAAIFFCRRHDLSFLATADVYVVTVPIGLGLGRLGNFLNNELHGRVTDVPWAMVFPGAGPEPRHPSQLYQSLLEGVVLFLILWFTAMGGKRRRPGTMLALFLLFYGIFRVTAELFRQPDPQIGFLFGFLTMGQLLSGIMIVAGLILLATRPKTNDR